MEERGKNSSKPKVSVLIVDDENDIKDILSLVFNQHFDADVSFASNGAEALLLGEKQHFDVITTDYQMPVMDGVAFIETLRKGQGINKHAPIIFITSYKPDLKADSEIWVNTLIVEKPFTLKKALFNIQCALKLNKSAA